MSGKRLLTVGLLLFVAVSAASLLFKEQRRRTSEGSRPAAAASTETSQAADGARTERPAPKEERSETAVPPGGVPAVRSAPSPPSARKSAPSREAPQQPSRKVVVYYLHTTVRCASCYRIESWTAATVAGDFAPEMGAGLLEWKVLNVEEPPNEHFIEDYRLFTKSVVLSEVHGGKEIRWKRLDRVWDLLGDEEAFRRYVGGEIRAFLGPS